MLFRLTPDIQLSVESPIVSLYGLHPVLNGAPLNARAEIVANEATHILLRYTAPVLGHGAFVVELVRDNESRAWLRYWIADLPIGFAPDTFGVCFERIENLRVYLRNGYTSKDGSFYVDPEADRTHVETGFAMTQLLPRRGEGCLVIGFDRHDRFQQTFTFDASVAPPPLVIQTCWDRKSPAKVAGSSQAGRLESERLVLFEHPQVEDALREWARLVAEASPTAARKSEPISGWCSWYNLYGYINEENILTHLHGVERIARQENLPMRVFQIDDGLTPEMGDWLDVKPQFPRSMRLLLDDIRTAGFTPGLWIAPFMVGNRSRLYREHPDWVVHERATDEPLVRWKFYGEFRWHKRSEEYYILDTTHPDAFEYLRQAFRTWRNDWGCGYFKTDFTFWGAEYGPDRARWHTEGMTRFEIWRRAMEMIRAEIGDALWLDCGLLWASVGLVDAVRIGNDVGVEWRGDLSAQSLLRDAAARNFANHILWQVDPDCILLRERFHHLSDAEVRALALFAGMIGGVTMTSDPLDELSPERLRLWKLLLAPGKCRFPFLGQFDPVLVQVRDGDPTSAVFIFNTGDAPVQRTFPLSLLGLADEQYVCDWAKETAIVTKTSKISVTLAPHNGALWFTSQAPNSSAPEHLP